jgi:hypothetical protein
MNPSYFLLISYSIYISMTFFLESRLRLPKNIKTNQKHEIFFIWDAPNTATNLARYPVNINAGYLIRPDTVNPAQHLHIFLVKYRTPA